MLIWVHEPFCQTLHHFLEWDSSCTGDKPVTRGVSSFLCVKPWALVLGVEEAELVLVLLRYTQSMYVPDWLTISELVLPCDPWRGNRWHRDTPGALSVISKVINVCVSG